MPRIYVKKLGPRGKCNYDKAYVQRAVAAVRKGSMSMRKASEHYGVPFSTIQRRFHGHHPLKYGRQPVFTENQELRIRDSLEVCAKWGFPLKSTDIRGIVQQYLNKLGVVERRFKHNLPGLDWFKSFMKRNRDLTIKLAENTKRVRAALSYEVIQEYFENLGRTIKDIPPSNIVNYDETNFVDDPGSVKVVTRRGAKHTHRTIDSSKSSTTVMFAIAADGTLLPPYTVYKAKHSYEGWTEGGIENARYNRSSSGWFDSELFEDWFRTIILPFFRKLNGPKVLIGDNLNSHITMSVIEECANNEIKFILLPPNSTHLLQPLDVAYFRPVKACWRRILEEWKIKHRGVLPKTEFPRLLKETIEKIGIRSEENSIAGFKACGISPWNPDIVLHKLPRNNPTVNRDNDDEHAWTQSIVEHLERLKSSTGTTGKRGKKINITAGKSISTADLIISTLIDKSPKRKPNKSTKKTQQPEEDSEESVLSDVSNFFESENEEDSMPGPSTFHNSDRSQEPSEAEGSDDENEKPDIGDFIIVEFPMVKRTRLFIGKIENIDGQELTINALRKKGVEKGYFVYPEIQDISVIDDHQVVKKVKLKYIKRGQHFFNISFDDFHNLE